MEWMLEITNAVGILERSTSEQSHHHLHRNHPHPLLGRKQQLFNSTQPRKMQISRKWKTQDPFQIVKGVKFEVKE